MKKKKWIGLMAALTMICTIMFGSIPVAAAGNALIPVKQVFTIGTAANPSAVSGLYTYTLTADNASCPMPSGSSGGVYTFTMNGNQELNVGPITTYTAAGLYTYKLREIIGSAVGYTYDHTVYDVLVYVIDNSGTLQTTVFIKKNGTKCAKAEFDPTYSDPPATPPASPSTTPSSGSSGSSGGGSGASHPGPTAGLSAGPGSGVTPVEPKAVAGNRRTLLKGGVPTGDESHLVLWSSIFLFSLTLLGIDLFILWKNRKEEEEQAKK